jgi:hypothetical protein
MASLLTPRVVLTKGKDEAAAHKLEGKSISDVLSLTAVQALRFLRGHASGLGMVLSKYRRQRRRITIVRTRCYRTRALAKPSTDR